MPSAAEVRTWACLPASCWGRRGSCSRSIRNSRSTFGQRSVALVPSTHDPGPAEFGTHAALTRGAKAGRQAGIARKPLECASELIGIGRRHQQPALLVFDDVGDATAIAAH